MNNKIKIKLRTKEDIDDFLYVTNSFLSDIDIIDGSVTLDAKSNMSIYSLDLSKEFQVQIISDNVDECRRFDAEMEEFK